MKLRHLKIFVAVSDMGSMTAAAKSLFVAQPTISQAISELEDYYGIKLFDRLSRHLYLTEHGKELLSYARHLIDLFDEMDQAMKNGENSGTIKVGASLSVGTYLLPNLINRFTKIHPHMKVNATIKNTQEIEDLILKNDIDLAIVEGRVHTAKIISRPFSDDRLVLVCGKDHPLFESGILLKEDMNMHSFIVREQGSGTRELFETTMSANDLQWEMLWECNASDCLKSAAISGIGIAVLSEKLIKEEVREGLLKIIDTPDIKLGRTFSVIYHKNKFLTNTMNALIDLCFDNNENI